jgi:hypothetical protein
MKGEGAAVHAALETLKQGVTQLGFPWVAI